MEIDFINIPPMLIQPFVENAIKHGMKGLPENKGLGKIDLTFSEKNGYLECVVLDNGVGREKSAKLHRESKETYHKSAGLEVTQERLKRISSDIDTPLEIIDLKENGEATGTKVVLRIPID